MARRPLTARVQNARRQLLERERLPWNRARCYYCKREMPEEQLTLDHIVPVSAGGKTSVENGVLACSPCNSFKADKPLVALVFSRVEWIKPLLANDPRGVLRHSYHWRHRDPKLGITRMAPIHLRTKIDAGSTFEGSTCEDANNKGDVWERWLWPFISSWRTHDVTCKRCLVAMAERGYAPLEFQLNIIRHGRMAAMQMETPVKLKILQREA